jgi:hypothetical protein
MTILDWRLMRERDPVVYCRHLGESPVLSIYEVDLTVTLVSPCVYMLAVIEKLLLGIRWCTSYAISCSKERSSHWNFLAIDTSRLDSPKQEYLQNDTSALRLAAFLRRRHPRQSREILKRLRQQLTRQGRTLRVPITTEFLGNAIGLYMD